MDPTSNEESTPWDPITGKLRTHTNLALPRGTREALGKHTGKDPFGEPQDYSRTSTRCPTTAAHSASTTALGSPRDMDRTQQARMGQSASQTNFRKRAASPQAAASGSGARAVRFIDGEQRSPDAAAMLTDPGRYDLRSDNEVTMRRNSPSGASRSDGFNAARYDVAPRGSPAARKLDENAAHVMHMKADPRNDMLNDASGHNADADGQTPMGIEVKERFSNMRTAFLKIDADFNGRITRQELTQACCSWNIPRAEAERVMNCADLDQNGYIDFDEFARRFDPCLEISADDDEMLRLYQEGIMGDEQPISLAGARHATSNAEPLIDEAAMYRTENEDLRSRLARAMRRISELEAELSHSDARNAEMQAALNAANARNVELQNMQDRNAELEGTNAELRRKLADAEADKRRSEEREKRLAKEAERRNAELKRKQDEAEEADRRNAEFRRKQDAAEEADRRAEEERRRRARQLEEEADRRRLEELERQLNATQFPQEADEDSKTVFVYGIEGCQATDAMHKALAKAKIPFKRRDFNKDKRYLPVVAKHESFYGATIHAPVVCLGSKAWWNTGDDTLNIPFPQAVCLDLRRELGLNITLDIVRVDVDIDSEIYERFQTMQAAFLKLDDDKDGFITEQELLGRCLEWNIPVSEAARAILEADKDGNSVLDFDEFAKRFGGVFNRGSRGALKGLAPAPHQSKSNLVRAGSGQIRSGGTSRSKR